MAAIPLAEDIEGLASIRMGNADQTIAEANAHPPVLLIAVLGKVGQLARIELVSLRRHSSLIKLV